MRNVTAAHAALVLAGSIGLLGAVSGNRELLLRVGQGEQVPSAVVVRTESVLLTRLRSVGGAGTVTLRSPTRLCVSIRAGTVVSLNRLLSSEGIIALGIVPHGPTYDAGGPPISRVRFGRDEIGQDSVSLTMSDSKSFRKFTTANLNRILGVYLDGSLIAEPMIVAPVDREVEITGNGVRGPNWRLLEAVVASGPLPTTVTILRAHCD
jgi:hypothetical protein